MKYTLTLEVESPKEIWDTLYIFKDWNADNYEEQIIKGIKFDRWYDELKEWKFEFQTSTNLEFHYSNEFYPNLENEEYYKELEQTKHFSYFNKFYTKKWAELQKEWRKKQKIIKLEATLK